MRLDLYLRLICSLLLGMVVRELIVFLTAILVVVFSVPQIFLAPSVFNDFRLLAGFRVRDSMGCRLPTWPGAAVCFAGWVSERAVSCLCLPRRTTCDQERSVFRFSASTASTLLDSSCTVERSSRISAFSASMQSFSSVTVDSL